MRAQSQSLMAVAYTFKSTSPFGVWLFDIAKLEDTGRAEFGEYDSVHSRGLAR